MLGVFGIALSLGLLMYLAYKGHSVIILAPVLALLAAVINGGDGLLATYTETFMGSMAGFVKNNFPIFLTGAIFGNLIDVTGSAKAIANFIAEKLGPTQSMLAAVLSTAVLAYGGVSIFIVAFTIYPIAVTLFRKNDVPKRFIPACIAFGAFTFATYCLPGSPQVQNAIPMAYYGTNLYAAPVLGLIGAALELGLGMLWLNSRLKKARAAGEGYGDHVDNVKHVDDSDIPSFAVAIAPLVVFFLCNLAFTYLIIPSWDTSYLAAAPFNTKLSAVLGKWAIVVSLIIGSLLSIALNYNRLKNYIAQDLTKGVMNSLLPIINTGSEVGYGAIIASLAGFAIFKEFFFGVSSNPLVTEAIASSAIAGITGSASGGLSIALGALANDFMALADASGVSYDVLHRIAVVACGGLDSLPHNGAVIVILTVCGLTHKQSYKDIGVCTVIVPTVTVAILIVLATLGINF